MKREGRRTSSCLRRLALCFAFDRGCHQNQASHGNRGDHHSFHKCSLALTCVRINRYAYSSDASVLESVFTYQNYNAWKILRILQIVRIYVAKSFVVVLSFYSWLAYFGLATVQIRHQLLPHVTIQVLPERRAVHTQERGRPLVHSGSRPSSAIVAAISLLIVHTWAFWFRYQVI